MRRLVEATLVSLDGVVEAPHRWAVFDDEAKAVSLAALEHYDGFLMGRVTFESFREMWSSVRGDPYLDAINAARKYVVSASLATVDWNAELLHGDPVAQIEALKRQPGKDLVKYGTSLLDELLLRHRLVDEFQLWFVPVIVGSGTRLFEGMSSVVPRLTVVDTRTLANGGVIMRCRPDYESSQGHV